MSSPAGSRPTPVKTQNAEQSRVMLRNPPHSHFQDVPFGDNSKIWKCQIFIVFWLKLVFSECRTSLVSCDATHNTALNWFACSILFGYRPQISLSMNACMNMWAWVSGRLDEGIHDSIVAEMQVNGRSAWCE